MDGFMFLLFVCSERFRADRRKNAQNVSFNSKRRQHKSTAGAPEGKQPAELPQEPRARSAGIPEKRQERATNWINRMGRGADG